MSRPLRVLVVDDELLARRRLGRLLEAMADVEQVGEATDAASALELLAEEAVDVVLLDIHMPGLSGLEASALMGEQGPSVVFVTAHPQHALEAFGVGADDYVLKPADAQRLKVALDRVRARRTTGEEAPLLTGQLALPTRKGVRLLPVGELCCALFDGSAVIVHTATEKHYVDTTLRALEERLSDPPFVRVHRRALVNLEQVRLLENQATGGYVARLNGGLSVDVSRQAARDLRRRLGLSRG